MSDLYDVTDHDGEFIHLEVEGRTRALELARQIARADGRSAFIQRSVDPDVEGSEALYAASNDAEEVLAAEGAK